MKIMGNILSLIIVVLGSSTAQAQQVSDPRIADIVQSGKLRVGIGLANRASRTQRQENYEE